MKRNRYAPLSVAVGMMLALTACSAASPTTDPTDEPSAETRSPVSDRVSDGTLKLGYVLPETGSLSGLGTGIIAGVKLAVSDIAAYGGAGKPIVELVGGDEAGDPTIAGQTVDRLLSQDVDAVIGPVSSAISLSVIDKITGSGVMQCAGANTSATFSTYDSNGLYFRSIA
ncbi:MAG TPA: ABC transporter substrate-binding protein, partial [Homoserinimonas sp.]|nr:ABC transporter substrate-binding protein [Homoserinimonas sp.]